MAVTIVNMEIAIVKMKKELRLQYARSSKPLHGFTLVELLVVISIIALLLSVLMPALSRAKQQAKRTVCKSNLKQIGVAFFTYSIGNGDFLPNVGYCEGSRVHNDDRGLWDWDVEMRDYLLGKYALGKKMWYCPSVDYKGLDENYWRPDLVPPTPYKVTVGYVYTAYLGAKCPECGQWYGGNSWRDGPGPTYARWCPMKKFADKGASSQALMTDSVHYHITGDAWRGGHYKSGKTKMDWVYKKPEGSNQLFGDGHSEWLTIDKLLDRRVPGAVVQIMW